MKTYYIEQWNRTVGIIALMMLCVHTVVAQPSVDGKLAKSFRGVWQLKEVGESGKNNLRESPFHQYKYYGKNRFMMLTLADNKEEKIKDTDIIATRFSVKWGNLSFASDDMVMEGYDTIRLDKKGKRRFRLRWTNRMPNYRLCPKGSVVEEIWKKTDYSKEADLILKTIAMTGKIKNKFIGLWRRETIFFYARTEGTVGTMLPISDHATYKIYGDKVSLLINKIDFDPHLKTSHIKGEMRRQKYVGSNALEENGTECLVGWEDEDTFQLTYFDDNRMPFIEIWTRVKMPSYILDAIREAE